MELRERRIESAGPTLVVLEGGDLAGAPVLVHHGTPGSGLLYRPHLEHALVHGIRLIGYSRPGYGGSTRAPGRSVADAAADVVAIADALWLYRLVVVGGSGGGPHALACGALLPERVAAVAALASVAPYPADGLDWLAGMGEDNIQEFTAALAGAETLEPLLRGLADEMLGAYPETIAEALRSLLSAADEAALTGELAAFFVESTHLGLSEGVEGWLDDDLAFAKPWGFSPAEIRVPVLLWQGAQDRFVPLAHGRWLAERIPGVDAHLTEEDGHLTLVDRAPEVHAWLLERLR